MRTAVKYIVEKAWRPVVVKYLSKTRTYRYQDIQLEIPSTVFHPGFFFSTKLLLQQLKKFELKNKKLLEPGAGSGLISIWAAKQGAKVTSSDMNPDAINCLEKNSNENDVHLTIIESDLFQKIPVQQFDIIAINPPYYKKSRHHGQIMPGIAAKTGNIFRNFFRS